MIRKRQCAIDWSEVVLWLIVAVAIGLFVWFIVWIIGEARETDRSLTICLTAGYSTKVTIGDVGMCVGVDMQTGEPEIEPLDDVRARLEEN